MSQKKGQFFIITAVLVGMLLVAFLLHQLTYKTSQPVREESAINLFNNIKDKSKHTVILSSEKEEINYTQIEQNLESFKSYSLEQCKESYVDCNLDFKLEGNIALFDLTIKADDLYLHDSYKQNIEKKKSKIVADAGADKFANIGEITLFDGSGSFSTNKINSYVWDFGDGQSAEGEKVEHSYAEKGTYTVTLTVSDEKNQSDSDEAIVTTTELEIFAEAGGDKRELIQTIITFSGANSYSTKGEIISYTWDFGDGQSAEGIEVNHAYGEEGTYIVTLIIRDDKGNTAIDTATIEITNVLLQSPVAEAGEEKSAKISEAISFDGSKSYDSDGEIIKYAWDFGDGTTGEGEKVEHIYSTIGEFIAKLTVTDNDGLTDTDTTLVEIISESQITADAGPDQQTTIGKEVCFDASKSTPQITQYSWDFGDGEKATGQKVCHTYTLEGTYTVTLTVVDSLGNTAKDTATIIITKTLLIHPVADVGEDKEITAGTTITLDASKSYDSDGFITKYEWKLPDGTIKSGKTLELNLNPGTYTITLTVTDNSGLTDIDVITIVVKEKQETKCSLQDSTGFKTTVESVTDKGDVISVKLSTTAVAVSYSLSHIVFGLDSCAYETAKKTAVSSPNWPIEIVTPDSTTKINGLKYDETKLIGGQTTTFTFEIPKTCINSMMVATKAGNSVSYITLPKECFTS